MNTGALKAAILIVSETASRDSSTDKCGPILQDVFNQEGGGQWEVSEIKIVPDSIYHIQGFIKQHADGLDTLNLIVTSGGTGFAVEDYTPEAVSSLLHKNAPGLVHGMLAASLNVTPFALMSRPVAGVRNKTLIVTLPGSPKGARENLQAILKLLPHACLQAAGADSREIHVGGVEKLEKEAGVKPGPSSVITPELQEEVAKGSHKHHVHFHSHSHDHGRHGHGHITPIPHTKPGSHPVSNDPNAGPSRRHRASPYPMLSVNDALTLIAEHTPVPRVTRTPLRPDIVGCILAEDVKAAESVPAFRASIVDGYAVKFPESGKFAKGVYPVAIISHAHAGTLPPLQDGQIARITTGAPLPPGASAVVMVEDTILKTKTPDGSEEAEVEILTDTIKPGENVREVGSDVMAGHAIMKKGEGISATGGEFGLLASVGTKEVAIYQKPSVGVLSTGDEIVPHDRPGDLRVGEVRDTNKPTLLTAIRACGFEAVDLGIVSDKPGALESTLRISLRKVDIIITTGGVSMGELDLLKPTIERQLGGTIHFGRVNMKPGKPTTFATVPIKMSSLPAPSLATSFPDTAQSHAPPPPQDVAHTGRVDKLIFSLPGNPASAVVTFHLFVLPSLHKYCGISPTGLPYVKVTVEQNVRRDPQRPEYHRVIITARKDGMLYASSTGGQRSSRIGSFKGANGLIIVPAGDGLIKKGDRIGGLLLGQVVGDREK